MKYIIIEQKQNGRISTVNVNKWRLGNVTEFKEKYVVCDIASYSVFSTVYVQFLNRSIRRYLKIAPFSYENVINS
jgi:hypothetical protein